MKTVIAYDKRGRVTAVGVPNPEFGDDIVMEPTGGDASITIDSSEIVKSAEQFTFVTAGEPGDRLQEFLRTIAERYRVDPATRRLVAKK